MDADARETSTKEKRELRTKKKMDAPETSTVPSTYDVLLSFRGADTRISITDYLYNSLEAAKLHVFRDDGELPHGEPIDLHLLRAMRTCRIAIPIISEHYVQSRWCLRELADIMDCREKHGISVFPVFYKVDVLDLRDQRGNFGEALRVTEMGSGSEEAQRWKKALISVTKIRGWISPAVDSGVGRRKESNCTHEGELVDMMDTVDMVVAKVSSELKKTWIERFIRSVHLPFSGKKRTESECQVYLAFRGTDTRHGFATYLYTSLVAEGIRVFRYDNPSLIGKDVIEETANAMRQCKIFIPILSKNYASSYWCLNELAQIVDLKMEKKILPIFYKVEPSQVQDIFHKFRNDMLQHEDLEDLEGRFNYEKWEEAISEVESSGWTLKPDGHEWELVKQVVEEVSRSLKNPQTHDPPPPSSEHPHPSPLKLDSV